MKLLTRQFFSASVLIATLCLGSNVALADPTKVVYHIDDSATQATRTLRSLRNHLDVAPKTKITVVALGDGVAAAKRGAQRQGVHATQPIEAEGAGVDDGPGVVVAASGVGGHEVFGRGCCEMCLAKGG